MNGFLRTFVVGLALLFLLLVAGLVTLGLATDGRIKMVLRQWVLDDKEEELLTRAEERPSEPPKIREQRGRDHEALIEELASNVARTQIQELRAELTQQRNLLAEQRAYLERRQADLTIAEGDLERRMRQLEDLRRQIASESSQLKKDMAEWARLRAEEAQRVQVLDAVEKARIAEQADVFAQMKTAAWNHLRTFKPQEIARYLALMEPKVAARILKQAVEDPEQPGLAHEITKDWLTLDLDGISGDQVQRLAELYALMPADEVAQYLQQTRLPDVAAIYTRLSALNRKKAGQVLEALRIRDPDLERQLLRYIDESTAGGGAS